MPALVYHVLQATTPDNTQYEIRPSNWNSAHAVSLSVVGSEVIGAFTNADNVSFYLTNGGVAANYAQSNQTIGAYILGNSTINSATTFDARSMGYSAVGNIVIGIVGSNFIFSVANQTNNGGVAIAAGANSQSTGIVKLQNANNVTFGMDTAGNVTANASYATGIVVGASNGAALLSNLSFNNSNGLSWGLSNGVLTGAYTVPNALQSLYIAADNGSSANVQGLYFGNGGGVQFGVNGSVITAGIASSQVAALLYAYGNTTLGSSNLRYGVSAFYSGAGNISLGFNGNTLVFSGSQSIQPLALYAGGFTASNSSSLLTGNSLSVIGQGLATVGYTNGALVINVGGGSVTNNGIGLAAGGSTQNTGVLVLPNSNGFSWSINAGSLFGSFTPGPSAGIASVIAGGTTITSGGLNFANSNGLTWTLNASGQLVGAYSQAAQSVQPVAVAGSNGSYNFSTLNLGNANGVSFYTSASSVIASIYQPVAVAGSNGSFAFSTLNFGNSNGISFYTSNGSMLAAYSVPTVSNLLSAFGVSAGAQSANLQTLVFGGTSTANNVAFGLSNGVLTANVSAANIGISAGAQATVQSNLILGNNSNISFYLSQGTVFGSLGSNSQSNQSVGVYCVSNTTGVGTYLTYDARSLSVAGAGNVSVGNSLGYLMISGGGIGISANGSSQSNGVVVFANSNNMAFGMNSNGVITGAFTQSNQSVGLYFNGNLASGGSSYGTVDARSLNVVGYGAASVGFVGNSLAVSVPTGYVGSLNVYAGGSNTTGAQASSAFNISNLQIAGYGIVSVGILAGSLIISSPASTAYPFAVSAPNGSFNFTTLNFASGVGNVTFGTTTGNQVYANAAATGGGGSNTYSATLNVATALATTVNNYNPGTPWGISSTAVVQVLQVTPASNSGAGTIMTGLSSSGIPVGTTLILQNMSATDVLQLPYLNNLSSAGNQFASVGAGGGTVVAPGDCVLLFLAPNASGTIDNWRVL